ncbi:MAG TPA: leucine-rich repeat protein, partial [Bacillota bacterium]|nr:leucine-rich repeat protein [Bacillota bacterium]
MKQIIKTLLILCLLTVTSAMWACVNETTGNVLIDGSTEGLEFELIENANEYAVVGYEGTSEEVVIASTYQGFSVTKIAATAFLDANVTSLSLPDTINLIEVEALANLDLTEFLIPSGVYYFAQAFGENRENIDFKVANDHPYLKEVSMAGHSVIVSKDEKTVLLVENQSLWRRTLKLAGSYEEIAPYAFSYTDYKGIVIPSSVTEIGAYAFSHVDTETITINA